MKDEFKFKLNMSRAKDRITLRKLMRQIVQEVMDNGDYLTEIIVDKDIDELPLWGEKERKVILGHLVKGADIILRFKYYGRQGIARKESN